MQREKGIASNLLLLVACFIITISYSRITGNYESWNRIKYVGFIIILAILFFGERVRLNMRADHLLLSLYFLFFTIASIVSQDLSAGATILALFYTIVLLLYVFKGYVALNRQYSYFFAAAGILLGIVLVLILSRDVLRVQWLIARNGRIRVYGLFSHPNIYASMLLAVSMLLDAGIRRDSPRGFWRVLAIAGILISLAMIYYTNSRTTMILAVVYFTVIYYKAIRNQLHNKTLFTLFVAIVFLIALYLFFSEYILKQETFYTRIDDYMEFSLKGTEILFGHSFSSSLEGKSFEFAPYTMLYRAGAAGMLGYLMLFIWLFSECRKKKNQTAALACTTVLAVSVFAEAYIMNITHVFSCIAYLLISSEVIADEGRRSNEAPER